MMSSPGATTSPREQKAESLPPVDESTKDATKEEGEDTNDDEKQEEMKPDAAGLGTNPDEEDESRSNASPAAAEDTPPLPNEPIPEGPPLPNEPVPQPEDDGWDCQWDPNTQTWFFYNRFTGKSQWENPRVPNAASAAANGTGAGATTSAAQAGEPQPPVYEKPAAGGYNPAIHGDYDPNAWYAKGNDEDEHDHSAATLADPSMYSATVAFNRQNGHFQTGDMGPERHTDDAKSRRQMNAYFDVDAAANAHGGRSLKAERSNKKPTKSELKAFKEKRRAKKEEKRRAWLRD